MEHIPEITPENTSPANNQPQAPSGAPQVELRRGAGLLRVKRAAERRAEQSRRAPRRVFSAHPATQTAGTSNHSSPRRPFASALRSRPIGTPTRDPQSGDRPQRKQPSSRRPMNAGRPMRGKMPRQPQVSVSTEPASNETVKIVPPERDSIRIIPLGGVEEVGKNMTAIEFRGNIIIVDMGVQFSGEDAPGVDFIIPDISYLEARKDKIRGVFITHGHLDHTGGIPYMLHRVGNPPLYTRMFTSLFIKKRQEEFPHLPHMNLEIVETNSKVKIAEDFTVRFFGVTHTVPDSMGIIIETPYGNIIFTGDLKIDHTSGMPTQEEIATYSSLGRENNLALLMDSSNSEKPGFSFSEREIEGNLRKIISEVPGRLIVGTFASLLTRIAFIIQTAEDLGKKVCITGRSMKTNVDIAKIVGLIKAKPSTFIQPENVIDYPPNKVVIMGTGAQGDEFAALNLMGQKKHKIKLHKGDTILLSSSIIPGNELSVARLKDKLARQNVRIIHFRVADVHASGHANSEEMFWVLTQIRPKFFIPVHGSHYMLRLHEEIAIRAGVPEENIVVPDNGMIIEIREEGKKIVATKDRVAQGVVMVDALGRGDVKEVVIRDRQVLAEEGMFIVVGVIDHATGKIKQSPDIISRGFIYLKESQEILRQSRFIVRKTVEESIKDMHPINFDYVKNLVRERLGKYLLQETGKRPIIIPVLLEV